MPMTQAGRAAPLEIAIGIRIRARRRQLGMSQADLAERLGVSFQQVQKYERGSNRAAASTLMAAADALNTTVSWLVGEDGPSTPADDDLFRALSRPGAVEMLQAFDAISEPRSRAALLALAQEMAGRRS